VIEFWCGVRMGLGMPVFDKLGLDLAKAVMSLAGPTKGFENRLRLQWHPC